MMSLLVWYLTTVVSNAQKNQFIRLLFSVLLHTRLLSPVVTINSTRRLVSAFKVAKYSPAAIVR